jgi:hypothetical protein
VVSRHRKKRLWFTPGDVRFNVRNVLRNIIAVSGAASGALCLARVSLGCKAIVWRLDCFGAAPLGLTGIVRIQQVVGCGRSDRVSLE